MKLWYFGGLFIDGQLDMRNDNFLWKTWVNYIKKSLEKIQYRKYKGRLELGVTEFAERGFLSSPWFAQDRYYGNLSITDSESKIKKSHAFKIVAQ